MASAYPKLLLASASPRRREILANAGLQFEVLSVDTDESRLSQESPKAIVRRLAEQKARTALQQTQNAPGLHGLSGLPVLGADTVVAVDGTVLGKPATTGEAAAMLGLLAGRSHQVLTGVALLFAAGQRTDVQVATTRVDFLPLTSEQITEYVLSGEPMDKAGAYGIQGLASKFVEKIDGCYFNVVGLPISLVCRMLEQHRDWWPSADTRQAS